MGTGHQVSTVRNNFPGNPLVGLTQSPNQAARDRVQRMHSGPSPARLDAKGERAQREAKHSGRGGGTTHNANGRVTV